MKIAASTINAIYPVIKAMAQAGTVPQKELPTIHQTLKKLCSGADKTSKPKQRSKMLTADEVADRLGICKRTVLRMNRDGQLKGVYLRGTAKSLRFSEKEVEQFLNVEA